MVGRGTTLRARWHSAFLVLFVVIVLAATANVVTTGMVIDTFRTTAQRVDRDAALRARVRTEMATHSGLLHRQIDGADVDLGRVTASAASVRSVFDQGLTDADSPLERDLLQRTRDRWELVAAGPDDRGTGPLGHELRHQWIDAGTEEVAALLSDVGAANHAATQADLARAADLERGTVFVRWGFGVVLLGLILRFARRLSTEVLRPLSLLRDSADELAAGKLDHRVPVTRDDEIGQLGACFNAMAEAISGNQRSLSRRANEDSLTGLPNRAAFDAVLEATLAVPERRGGVQALLFIDLDDFKDVNDTLGHAAGDELLRVVAARLEATVRGGDVVARLSGDEFALLLDGCASAALAVSVAERAVAAVREPVEVGGTWVQVGASVGLAVRRADSDPGTLMRQADLAMYAAKGRGKNRVQRYDASLDAAALVDPEEDAAVGPELPQVEAAGVAGRGGTP